MKIDMIINHFKKKGYRIRACMSGKIAVRQPDGFTKLFDSYNEAYRHYFK